MDGSRETVFPTQARHSRDDSWVMWLPPLGLVAAALVFGFNLPPWVFMWMISLALFFGFKWLTWWQNKGTSKSVARHAAYLFAWPGMDAKAFLNPTHRALRPEWAAWTGAGLKICFGAALLWGLARVAPGLLVQGWIGLVGLIFLLHFGTFQLIALAWQRAGVNAQPLMRAPILATSLSEFWGARWNSAFNRLVHDLLFRRVYRLFGVVWATLIVFLISGLVHELVISLPARGGYGLPTMYFVIQGVGLLFERSRAGKRLGLQGGVRGWFYTMMVTAGPVFWLFHPAFITRVILPFLHVLNAI